MPKVNDVSSLFSLCLNRIKMILINIDISVDVGRSMKPTTGTTMENEPDINPFHILPTTLLEVIISSCNSINKTEKKPSNIELLITTELKKLIFPRLYCYKYEQYEKFFPKLEKLQVLVLRNTNVDNFCLKLIGKWCKNLRILDVNECSRLTDIGIEWLVQSQQLRKSLQQLLITCPGITIEGTKIAVQNCSALQLVENEHIFSVLVEMAQAAELAQHKNQILNFSFTHLIIYSSLPYSSANIELVIKYCPLLYDIIFIIKKGITDTDLSSLRNLKNLLKLKFYAHPNSKKDEITFDKGLAPALKVIGSSLKILVLSYFKFADIWTIAKYCPNLVSLNFKSQCQSLSVLSENEIIQLRDEKSSALFKELKVLWCGFNLSKDILFDLLSCPLLERVYFSVCNTLTDDFLKEAISYGLFKNLKVLSFYYSDYVTKEGLDGIVKNDNNLEEMNILFCDKVTQAHVLDWHKFAIQKNWKLNLFFEDDHTARTNYY